MRPGSWTLSAAALAGAASAASLSDVCTTTYAQSALSSLNVSNAIAIDLSSVVTAAVANYSVSGQLMYPDASFSYCNVTFAYSHVGRDDRVQLTYWLPAPASFEKRFLATGGGGYAINSGSQSIAGGIPYGAAAGITDGGFGSFDESFNYVFLLADGTPDWELLYMFGYQGINEMSVIGKAFTKAFFNMSASDKLYSYYQGCSEGGREGWSQIQRYADSFDGAIVGAPAFRFAFQQVQHTWSDIVEQDLAYYPPPCELEAIMNATIAACDGLDGRTDGVVARSDLCKLQFDIASLVGTPYACAASAAVVEGFPPHPAWPAQNGSVTAQGVAVAQKAIDGIRDSQGRRVYLSYQPGAQFVDAFTQYSNSSGAFELWPSDFGAQFVLPFIYEQNASAFTTLAGVTPDTLKSWIYTGWQKYQDTLHTTWPDLTPYHEAGGKILHYHGEQDFSIPTASSVHYRDSVRTIMYPDLDYNASSAALADWYQLFLVPGAAHCSTNPFQPDGPWPQTNLAVMIEWVEKGVRPETLNATVLAGEGVGGNEQICAFPLRPLWMGNATMECVYDQASIDSWEYTFDAFKLPVY